MKNWQKILVILIVIIGYIFIINLFANLISITYENQKITTKTIIINRGNIVELGVSDSVSILVVRKPHWYGKRVVKDGKEYLYLFYFIKLPHKIKGYPFYWFHLIFLIILILLCLLIFLKPKVYKHNNSYLDYENLAQNSYDYYN